MPQPTDLTVEQRACLLRAARRRLRGLQAEMERLKSLPIRHAIGPIEATQAELDCLSGAITKLWLQNTGSVPP